MKTILPLNVLARCLMSGAFLLLTPLLPAAPLPNAWQITDNSTASGSVLYYTNILSLQDHTAATNHGFRFSVQARFVNDFNGSKTMNMIYGMGARRFQVWWYLDANNDLMAEIESGNTYRLTTNGTGTNFFHTHEIVFDSSIHSASYLVDGELKANDLSPVAVARPAGAVQWGAGASAGKGQMNFHRVSFEITNRVVALYDAGVAGELPTAPDPTTVGWFRHQAVPLANTGGTNVSPDSAPRPAAPDATTLAATGVQPYQAILSGGINPRGLSTAYWFEWGASASYGNFTPLRSLMSGANETIVTATLTGLSKGIAYHFRCAASNDLGITYGQSVMFVTPLHFSVATLADSGYGSLRQAIAGARSGDTVYFTTNGTLTLTSGALDITNDLTIAGPGPRNLAISGNNLTRVISISSGAVVSISGLTIRNGRTWDASDATSLTSGHRDAPGGGGILNFGELALSNCVITANATGRGGNGFSPTADSRGTPGGAGGNGAGIYNLGILSLNLCTVVSNACGAGGTGGNGAHAIDSTGNSGWDGARGGAGGVGGGIFNLGSATFVASLIASNRAGLGGNGGAGGNGGVGFFGKGGDGGGGGNGGHGGGLYNYGGASLSLSSCTLNNNAAGGAGTGGAGGIKSDTAGNGGTSGSGGGLFNASTATIIGCTLSGNITRNGGTGSSAYYEQQGAGGNGGNAGHGGGIYNSNALTLTACTLSQNRTGNGGHGGDQAAQSMSAGGAGGEGGDGGGVFNFAEAPAINLRNSLIALNTNGVAGTSGSGGPRNGLPGTGPDGHGVFRTYGYNLIGQSDQAGFAPSVQPTDFILGPGLKMLPSLGPLANNGGPVKTMALLPGSVAIDAGDDSLTATLTTDERGYLRSSGGHVDIGAFEVQVADPANPPRIASTRVEANNALTLSFTNNPGLRFQVLASTNVALPLSQWLRLGTATQLSPGQYQYTDPTAPNHPHRFYQVVWP
ncbi:MAG TPA: choice-of-anchor Q domain-containing protein [Verrucomicrobiae bacterium]|nr:choice-of-anchor Q domain-containing protein [Verrucomicrobiae bacterium]